MKKSTNGGDELETVITEEDDSSKTVIEESSKVDNELDEGPDEQEEIRVSDLLKPKSETKKEYTEEEKAEFKALQKEKFNLALKFNMKQVEKKLDEGVELEEALEGVPQHLQGHIKGIINSDDALEPEDKEPDTDTLIENKLKEIREQEEGETLFSKIVSENELKGKQAKEFAEDVVRRRSLGHSLRESVLDASARLGFSSKDAIKEAEERGLLRGLRAAPPEGEPVLKKAKSKELTSSQKSMAERFGNKPEEVYGA